MTLSLAFGVGVLFSAASVTSVAGAPPGTQKDCIVIQGGEVPTPFKDANKKVELADGESYQLIGRVVFPTGEPFLHVDLTQHDWLGNKRRSLNPLYPLIQGGFDWHKYEGVWVSVNVTAEGRIIPGLIGQPYYDLFLQPMDEPKALSPQAD